MCEPLIDAKQAATILDSCPRTLKRMASRGEIPALQIGNRWKFRKSELDEWMKSALTSNRHPRSLKGEQ